MSISNQAEAFSMLEPGLIETARLTLRALTVADATALHPLFQDAMAMRYWHTLPHATVRETAAELAGMIKHGGCWWAICLNREEQGCEQPLIGFAGYHHTVGRSGFGYMLHPDHWRKGYATEAVHAALTYGFTQLAIERVELWIHEQNLASRRLAERLGFTNKGQFLQKFANEPASHMTQVYGMRIEEWPARPQNLPPLEPVCSFYNVQPILAVNDIEATLTYYQEKLGFTVDFVYGAPPSHAGVSRGEWTVHGVQIQFTLADTPNASRPVGQLYLMVGVGIEQLYAAYCASGVHIHRSLASQPWGMREFSIEDLNGYVLRFGTPA
ncbi:MAG: GNAT family N-acetyltransferase [Chloroflexi bacterium]|nr:GNAT family N-acetyltransferase [Chloroflexota bacterium]